MEDKPLVSIVTPSFNQGRFIEDTILSVKNQDYPNIEHIIVDGGSTDNTLEILKKYENTYNMRWISEPDEGQSDAVNKGFRMAKGEIVGWLNSDDIYFTKDVISYVVEQFMKNPDVDVIYGDDALINENNTIFAVRKLFDWDYNKLLRGLSISQPATFFRRKIILTNYLRKDLHFSMDLELWLRLGRNHKFLHVRKILAGNRVHRKRKRISGAQKAKIEDRKLIESYGGRFGLKYLLLHYFSDLPSIQFKKMLGISTILGTRGENRLAFRGNHNNALSLIFSQISPLRLLLFFKIV